MDSRCGRPKQGQCRKIITHRKRDRIYGRDPHLWNFLLLGFIISIIRKGKERIL